jgi:histidyl-tRNA synthetase
MLAALERLDRLPHVRTPADVLVVQFSRQWLGRYLHLASQLRAAGLNVEVYSDDRKLANQFKYADQRGFVVCVIAGETEFNANQVRLKWLKTGEQVDVPLEPDAASLIRTLRTGLTGPEPDAARVDAANSPAW